jgi:hypothetical protein
MFIVFDHNRKRLGMDRSRYYSPEELQDRALRVSVNGLFLEVVPMHYQSIKNHTELLFACKLVSMYHVSLHNDGEIDTRTVAESLFMDTTLQTVHSGNENPSSAVVEDESYEPMDSVSVNMSSDFYTPPESDYSEYTSPMCNDVSWNGKHVKSLSVKRERRNLKRNNPCYLMCPESGSAADRVVNTASGKSDV